MTMPYYKSYSENTVEAFSGPSSTYQLQTSLFAENIGWRSRPKDGTRSTLLSGSQAEPFSWLDANNRIKQQTYVSADPELASLFKKDKGHNWDCLTADIQGGLWSYDVWKGSLPIANRRNNRPYPTLTGGRAPLDLLASATTDLNSYAALEYGRTAPTADQFSISAFIGELREGLPALIPALLGTGSKRNFKSTLQRQTRRAKDAGSDYLNVQFGWIPLLNDVRSIASALAVATSAISGNGLETHRRRFKPDKDVTLVGTSALSSNTLRESSALFGTVGPGTATTIGQGLLADNWVNQRHQIDFSFEAEFLRLPEGTKDYGPYLEKFDELFRWDITPQDLWQLAPWSWLVDWFFDIGGQLDAWGSATSNRILSLYAYGMRDERLTTTSVVSNIRISASFPTYSYVGPRSVFTQYNVRRRQRVKANPFGYTLNPLTSLNGGQLAILAALGLTKIKR
jgi:hypothetical protein